MKITKLVHPSSSRENLEIQRNFRPFSTRKQTKRPTHSEARPLMFFARFSRANDCQVSEDDLSRLVWRARFVRQRRIINDDVGNKACRAPIKSQKPTFSPRATPKSRKASRRRKAFAKLPSRGCQLHSASGKLIGAAKCSILRIYGHVNIILCVRRSKCVFFE